jgi:hypothetical protein
LFAAGTAFDIYFRVIETGTTNVVLQSDCYRIHRAELIGTLMESEAGGGVRRSRGRPALDPAHRSNSVSVALPIPAFDHFCVRAGHSTQFRVRCH